MSNNNNNNNTVKLWATNGIDVVEAERERENVTNTDKGVRKDA